MQGYKESAFDVLKNYINQYIDLLRSRGEIRSGQVIDVLANSIMDDWRNIRCELSRLYPENITDGALKDFAIKVVNFHLDRIYKNARNTYNGNDYLSRRSGSFDDSQSICAGVGGGLTGIATTESRNSLRYEPRNTDADCVKAVSEQNRELDRQRRNGDIDSSNTRMENKVVDGKKFKNTTDIVYIGNEINENEIPSVVKNTGDSLNPPAVSTEMYTITDSYTLTQNNVSRTKIVHVTLNKPVFNTKDAIGCLKNARPDLFQNEQYCVVLTFSKLKVYRCNNGGDIIFNKGNKFKDITTDVLSIGQFTDKFEPALKEIPKPLADLVNNIYFTRLNTITEYCLWNPKKPGFIIGIHKWNRMGLFSTVQDIPDQRTKENLIEYVSTMKSTYPREYEQTVFDIAKRSFEQTLSGKNGFIDVRKDHKELVPVLPNVNVTLDDRYFLRDLFMMPDSDRVRMLGIVARDHFVHQSERTVIVTNMRLSTSIDGSAINIVVNNTTELLNCLRCIVDVVNRTDLVVAQCKDNGEPIDCARLGLNISSEREPGLMKLRRIPCINN